VSYLERNAKKSNEHSGIVNTAQPQQTAMLGDTHQSGNNVKGTLGGVGNVDRRAAGLSMQQSSDTSVKLATTRKRSAPALPNTRTSRKTQRIHGIPRTFYEDETFLPPVASSDLDDNGSTTQANLNTTASSTADQIMDDQLRRFELADSLVKYIYRMDIATIDQSVVLDQLEAEWFNNRDDYRKSTTVLYTAFDGALTAWLELQRTVIAARHGKASDGNKAKAQRFLLWNKIRAQHLTWSTKMYQIRGHGLVGEQVLRLLFTNIASMWGADGLDTFEEGLKGLDDEIKELVRGGAMGGLMEQ
jgi:hypothetical protein